MDYDSDDRSELDEEEAMDYISESVKFLGENPDAQNAGQFTLKEDLADRLKVWIKKGLNAKKISRKF